MHEKKEEEKEDIVVHEMLRQIKAGQIDPKTISPISRRLCVEVLILEGHQNASVAQALKVSDKTIRRDIQEIRRKNALEPSVDLAKQMIGQFFQKAMNHHAYLTRLARSQKATVAEKTLAETAAWKVLKECLERFQFLGYLPLKPQEVIGHFFHQSEPDSTNDITAMKKQLVELEEQAKEMGIFDKETSSSIALLTEDVKQSEIKSRILDMKKQFKTREEDNED
ncbi:MAG: DeoR family transcriptional regulator [Candidatus Aadella gelida]|nr:DeoR family transcriptional regulator [Candidatus Aadella gelida]